MGQLPVSAVLGFSAPRMLFLRVSSPELRFLGSPLPDVAVSKGQLPLSAVLGFSAPRMLLQGVSSPQNGFWFTTNVEFVATQSATRRGLPNFRL